MKQLLRSLSLMTAVLVFPFSGMCEDSDIKPKVGAQYIRVQPTPNGASGSLDYEICNIDGSGCPEKLATLSQRQLTNLANYLQSYLTSPSDAAVMAVIGLFIPALVSGSIVGGISFFVIPPAAIPIGAAAFLAIEIAGGSVAYVNRVEYNEYIASLEKGLYSNVEIIIDRSFDDVLKEVVSFLNYAKNS